MSKPKTLQIIELYFVSVSLNFKPVNIQIALGKRTWLAVYYTNGMLGWLGSMHVTERKGIVDSKSIGTY